MTVIPMCSPQQHVDSIGSNEADAADIAGKQARDEHKGDGKDHHPAVVSLNLSLAAGLGREFHETHAGAHVFLRTAATKHSVIPLRDMKKT
jgi:hypothetical protein